MRIKKSILVRARWVFLSLILFSGLIISSLLKIQWVEGDQWREKSQKNAFKYVSVKATRGNIISSDDKLLATSLPLYKLALDPTVSTNQLFENQIDTLCSLISSFFKEKPASYYKNKLRKARLNGDKYELISKKFISYEEKEKLEKWPFLKEGRFSSGVIFEKVERRFKPFNQLARRTLGFIKPHSKEGKINGRGLEYSFNNLLAGNDGKALCYKTSTGIWRPVNDEFSNIEPENGHDIQTTLDIDLQNYSNDLLRKTLLKFEANYGCVVLMEVETGEIKIMTNLGKSGENYIENYNYAVGNQGVVEPGSTFKLASMIALLEETNTSIADTVDATTKGEFEFYETCVMKDASSWGHGKITVKEAFEKSSNIGVSRLVFDNFQETPKKFIGYLEKFGLNQPLGFQMKGEGTPFIDNPDQTTWSGCSLPWMSIGYEVKFSPLQILAFYNAIANDGKLLSPIIVKDILSGNKVVKSYSARTINPKVCSNKTLETIRELLEGVVIRGTAKNIYDPNLKVAGKTGTAHKFEKGSYTDKYYASFAGYFPADKPKYSCIVVIDDPKTAKYGGDVAAPLFYQIAQYVKKRKIKKDLEEVKLVHQENFPLIQSGNIEDLALLSDYFKLKTQSLNSEKWVNTNVKGDTVQWVNNTIAKGAIPNVQGMTLRDALFILENMGLKVNIFGNGRVKTQSIKPGTTLKKGSTIYLSLS